MEPPVSTLPSPPYGASAPYGQPGLNELSLSAVLDPHQTTQLAAGGGGTSYDDRRAASPDHAVNTISRADPELENTAVIGVKRPLEMPRTLPSVLVDFLRSQDRKSATEEEMYEEVRKVYTELRKPDGAKYTGNLERAVRGSLCSTGFFEKVGNNSWTLKEENARVYEQRLLDRFLKHEEEKSNRRREREKAAEAVIAQDGTRVKRRYVKRTQTTSRSKRNARREMILQMIARISERLKHHESWQDCWHNPFKNLKGSETDDDVWRKLGNDRFVFMLQMYNYFADILERRHGPGTDIDKKAPGRSLKSKNKNAEVTENLKSKQTKSLSSNIVDLTPDSVKTLTTRMDQLQDAVLKLNERLSYMSEEQ